MSNLNATEQRWHDWVTSTSTLLGIDPAMVDISAIHDLTKVIAHDLDRPLAPVSSFMWGLAIGARGADADPTALKDAIEATAHAAHAHAAEGPQAQA